MRLWYLALLMWMLAMAGVDRKVPAPANTPQTDGSMYDKDGPEPIPKPPGP